MTSGSSYCRSVPATIGPRMMRNWQSRPTIHNPFEPKSPRQILALGCAAGQTLQQCAVVPERRSRVRKRAAFPAAAEWKTEPPNFPQIQIGLLLAQTLNRCRARLSWRKRAGWNSRAAKVIAMAFRLGPQRPSCRSRPAATDSFFPVRRRMKPASAPQDPPSRRLAEFLRDRHWPICVQSLGACSTE